MQEMQLPDVLLPQNLSFAKLLRRLHVRPSHRLAHPGNGLAPEIPLVGQPHEGLGRGVVQHHQRVAQEYGFAQLLVGEIAGEAHGAFSPEGSPRSS